MASRQGMEMIHAIPSGLMNRNRDWSHEQLTGWSLAAEKATLISCAFTSRHLLPQWGLLTVRHREAQKEDLAHKCGAGGDGGGRRPHTRKRKLVVNSVLLSPINSSRFVAMPKSFIFCEALQKASKVRLRFYSLCKFSSPRSAKSVVFKWDPIT